jgi:hypothetical protein
VPQRRGGRDDRGGIGGRQLPDQLAERRYPGLPPGPQVSGAGRGERDQDHPLIAGVRAPLDQSRLLQRGDQRGHRWLGDPLAHRQVGDPARAGPLDRGQR